MGYPTDRIQLFDRSMNPLPELAPSEVTSRVRREEINGEHELTIVTTRRLEEGWRALTVDGTGKWYEWVVVETPEEHGDSGNAVGTYRLVWSLQYDLTHSYSHTHSEVGYGSMTKTATGTAELVLEDVANWEVGPCDAANIEAGLGCVFIYESAWSRLSKVVEVTGWEVDALIEVSNLYNVTARKLCLKAHVGNPSAVGGYDNNMLQRSANPTANEVTYARCNLLSEGVIRMVPTSTSNANFKWKMPHIDYKDCRNKTFTISFDAKLSTMSSSFTSSSVHVAAIAYTQDRVSSEVDSAYDCLSPYQEYIGLTSEWQRFAYVVNVPRDMRSGNTSALASGSYFSVAITVPSSKKPVEVRRVKLERGSIPTEWVQPLPSSGVSNMRRFDWGHDVTSIKRTPDPGPYYCRVVPLGKGTTEYADDDETSFEWPLDITEEEPNGNYYIEDIEAAAAFRISDGDGGWIYPTKAVSYNQDDPELLYREALNDIHNHTRPNVTYEANVVQFARAGMNVKGVALGDDVQIADRGFNPDSVLRLQGRVTSIQIDELSPETGTELTIGNLRDNMSNALSFMGKSLDSLVAQNSRITDSLRNMSTSQYINELLDRINAEINATGGYSYFVPGEGIITYDIAVDDPLVGYNSTTHSYATQVVQIKGGSIRIANSKEPNFAGIDDWQWKTVFTSGHVSAELVTAANITSGYIGNATGDNYWNLDNGTLRILAVDNAVTAANNASTAASNAAAAADDAAKVATNYLTFSSSTGLDVGYSGSSAKTRITTNGLEVFDGAGESALFAGLQSTKSIVRVGRESGSGNIIMSSDGYVDIRNATTTLAHFGYGRCYIFGSYTNSAYYDLGLRRSNSRVGAFSTVEGGCSDVSYQIAPNEIIAAPNSNTRNVASGANAHAEGGVCEATGDNSHAEGGYCVASGLSSHAGGWDCTASGFAAFAHGEGLSSNGSFVIGRYNSYTGSSGHLFVIGKGNANGSTVSRSDALRVDANGYVWISGTLTELSDRRLKEHHAYLGDDASQFIRALKPALYTKDGKRQLGFYAQDVQEAEPEGWDTATVTAHHTDDRLDFDPLSLDYNALIAPLVAYCQQLERRVEQLEKMVGAST